MVKILKFAGTILGVVLGAILVAVVVFVQTSPQFGAAPTAEQEKAYAQTDHWSDGTFVNRDAEFPNPNLIDFLQKAWDSDSAMSPAKPLNTLFPDVVEAQAYRDSAARFLWIGHSAILLQSAGLNMLFDPMLGDVPSPHPWFGPERYYDSLPLTPEQMPVLDAVFISHDHYDHLDYGSILELREKVRMFFVPLGVANHLREWGVASEDITELDWWQEVEWKGHIIVCTPSEHFSGRGILDRGKTLWCSWVVKGSSTNVYFSGDSGYGEHFAEIGAKYGPFDIAYLECGQYDELWPDIHMFPEETAMSALDLKANQAMPIHWGAFTLGLHTWKDPIERALQKGEELGLKLVYPQIGEWVYLHEQREYEKWWESVE